MLEQNLHLVDIQTDDILNLVRQELRKYCTPRVPKRSLHFSRFAFSPTLHQVRGSFWQVWYEAERGRKRFRALVHDVFKDLGVVPNAVISAMQWPNTLAQIRLHLANMLYDSAPELIIHNHGGDDVDFITVLLKKYQDIKPYYRHRLKLAGRLAEEIADGYCRQAITSILARLTYGQEAALLNVQYVSTHTQLLLRYYSCEETYIQRKRDRGLMENVRIPGLDVPNTLDAIIEEIVMMQMAHREGKLHIPEDIEDGRLECEANDICLGVWSRSYNFSLLINHLTQKFGTSPIWNKYGVSIEQCMRLSWESVRGDMND